MLRVEKYQRGELTEAVEDAANAREWDVSSRFKKTFL
jgi:hypothetical protein